MADVIAAAIEHCRIQHIGIYTIGIRNLLVDEKVHLNEKLALPGGYDSKYTLPILSEGEKIFIMHGNIGVTTNGSMIEWEIDHDYDNYVFKITLVNPDPYLLLDNTACKYKIKSFRQSLIKLSDDTLIFIINYFKTYKFNPIKLFDDMLNIILVNLRDLDKLKKINKDCTDRITMLENEQYSYIFQYEDIQKKYDDLLKKYDQIVKINKNILISKGSV